MLIVGILSEFVSKLILLQTFLSRDLHRYFFSLRSELENLPLKVTLRIVELSIWHNAIIIASDFQVLQGPRGGPFRFTSEI